MITPVELALPCRVVRLELRVGPEEGTTTLEDLVARALLAQQGRTRGPDGADQQTAAEYLAWLFAVPEPVVVDVIGSLWAKGFVTVNFSDGSVELSAVARELLSRGDSPAAGGEITYRDFLFEPITGLIRAAREGDRNARDGAVELPVRHGIAASDIPQAELVSGVQAALRRDEERAGRLNVLQASFGNPMLHAHHDFAWLHVRVAAYRDPQSDQLSVTVDEVQQWSARMQEHLQTYFRRLAEEEPDSPAVTQLRGRARTELEPSQNLDDLLSRLGQEIAELGSVEQSKVVERQRVLRGLARRARERLRAMREASAVVTLVRHPEGHEWVVSDLVTSARTQVVLIAPTLEFRRLKNLLPDLRHALDRGVQLVVLWGRAATDTVPERVATLLHELEGRRGAKILWVPELSAQTDAAAIIQDDCRALIGSHGVLGSAPPGAKEASVLVEPSPAGPTSPRVVQDLLRWARSEFPRWALGQRIKLQPDEFGGPAAAPVAGGRCADEPAVLTLDATTLNEATIPLWARSWADLHGALLESRAQIVAKTTPVELVRDGEHRIVLWEALRGARRRLVIADDQVDPRATNESLAHALRARRTAGVEVLLVHPELRSGDEAHRTFVDLRTGPGRIRIHIGRDRGRVLVHDDEAVLGSFSPLGDRRPGPGRRRTQLGVRVHDEEFAAELAAFLGASPVNPPPLVTGPAAPSDVTTISPLSLLTTARSAGSPREFGEVVAQRLRGADRPWDVLNQWRDTDVPVAELRSAVAALLGATPDRESPDAQRSLCWLVDDAWARGAFVEAAVLAQQLSGRPGALDSTADMAAALEIGPLGTIVSDGALALLDHPTAARTAGAAGAFAEVLLHAGLEGYQALELLAPELPSAWRDLVEPVLRLRTVPLPLAGVAIDQTRLDSLRMLESRRDAVAAEIDKIEQLRGRFTFATGMTLHDRLFAADGLLTVVRTAMRGSLEDCIALARHLPVDIRGHCNKMIAAAGGKPMVWHPHEYFLHSLEEIVRSARQVVAAAACGRLSDADAMALPPDCADLAIHLVGSWDMLFRQASGLGRPWSLPPLALINRLSPLEQWAREQA